VSRPLPAQFFLASAGNRGRGVSVPRGNPRAPREKFVTVAWMDVKLCARCASAGTDGYHEANYPASQVPSLLSRLRDAGVKTVSVDGLDRELNPHRNFRESQSQMLDRLEIGPRYCHTCRATVVRGGQFTACKRCVTKLRSDQGARRTNPQASAQAELRRKTREQIDAETARTWGNRAIGAFQLSMKARGPRERLRLYTDGEQYLHEAVEHAAGASAKLVGQVCRLVAPHARRAKAAMVELGRGNPLTAAESLAVVHEGEHARHPSARRALGRIVLEHGPSAGLLAADQEIRRARRHDVGNRAERLTRANPAVLFRDLDRAEALAWALRGVGYRGEVRACEGDWEVSTDAPASVLAELHRRSTRRNNFLPLIPAAASGIVGGSAWEGAKAVGKKIKRSPKRTNPLPAAFILTLGNEPGRRHRPRVRARRTNDGVTPFEIMLPRREILGTMPINEARRRWPDVKVQEAALLDFNKGMKINPDVILRDDGKPGVEVLWLGAKVPEFVYGGHGGSPEGSFKRSAGKVGGDQSEETTWVHENEGDTYFAGHAKMVNGRPVTRDFRVFGNMRAEKGWLRG
jgi:hypothetical protein